MPSSSCILCAASCPMIGRRVQVTLQQGGLDVGPLQLAYADVCVGLPVEEPRRLFDLSIR